MDILNDILIMLISGVSHEHLVSMGVVIILTTTLLFVDTIQRIAAEVLRYNKDNHRPNNPIMVGEKVSMLIKPQANGVDI